jgi:apolipoprotein N-acyltransferase
VSDGGSSFRTTGYPPAWRVVAALLHGISGASLPLLFFLLLTANDPPLSPQLLLRLFLIWVVAPAAAAWLIRRAFAVDVRIGTGALELARRDVQIDVPASTIARIEPWRLPLPQPGMSLRMQSGQRFRWGLAQDDPGRLLAALSLLAPQVTEQVIAHPSFVYARAKAAQQRLRAMYRIAKFAGFGLLPATVLFYTHQSIAHGGPFGEYYTFGLAAYLTTYGVYWSTVTIYLLLFASIWRALAEAICLLSAWFAPSTALGTRRWAERACTVLYFGGVPVVLALRYLG